MRDHQIGVWDTRTIPIDAGVITPEIVEFFKEDMLEDLAKDIIDMAEAYGFVKWEIDAHKRAISCDLKLTVREVGEHVQKSKESTDGLDAAEWARLVDLGVA